MNMKKKNFSIIAVLFIMVFIACEGGEQAPKLNIQKMLTPADIEQASEYTGVVLVKQDALPKAEGELNFAVNDTTVILKVDIIGVDEFNTYKEQKEYIAGTVADIGDEAFSAPAGIVQYILFFKKNKHALAMSSFLNPAAEPYLTMEQLKQLAKTIISRMQTTQRSEK
jgi:hypothetical protein